MFQLLLYSYLHVLSPRVVAIIPKSQIENVKGKENKVMPHYPKLAELGAELQKFHILLSKKRQKQAKNNKNIQFKIKYIKKNKFRIYYNFTLYN